jgi:UDP-GlcNAc:undecaprenyl-phosphate/decaprenyl-phosphate GlcNAc-1-phosphate transferase
MITLEYQELFAFITFLVSNKIMFFNTLLFILGFFLTFLSVPLIAEIARNTNLLAQPNGRSSHTSPIPAFGGISIFIGFLFMFLLLVPVISSQIAIIILSVSLIFIVGLIDDIVDLNATFKLIVFILIAVLISTTQGLTINDLHGFLSIHHLNVYIAIPLTVLVIVTIINAINLIDGIDGLASGLGIIILGVFSIIFYRSGHINYLFMTIPVILSLLAFMCFNIWGNRFKMFMGDSGSLVLGLVISISLIQFMGLKDSEINTVPVKISPVSVFALLIIPVFDMVHVFIKRIKRGRSPFLPGKEHIHHTYLKFGLSHASITLILMTYTILFFVLAQVLLFYLPGIVALGIILTMACFMWNFTEYKVEKQHIVNPLIRKRLKYHISKDIFIRPIIIRMSDFTLTRTKSA